MTAPERKRVWHGGRKQVRPKRAKPRRRDAPRFDRQEWDDASLKLFARSRGMCERCGNSLNGRGERHHRQRRRDGGDRLSNLLLICTDCHREITDKPESETRARALGYIVPALGIAEPDAYEVLLWGDTWVLLDDEGHAYACDKPARLS